MPETGQSWEVVPQGVFSRRGGETGASLRMSLWTEGCEFTIAGHSFAIRRVSLWRDGFQLFAGDQSVCEVKRGFWSRRFELSAVDETWALQPAGWFTRNYQLLRSDRVVGSVRPVGWLTRKRVAEFADEVPPPVQVFAIFLVLVVNQRQQRTSAAGAGN
jgi:hypothetical protein